MRQTLKFTNMTISDHQRSIGKLKLIGFMVRFTTGSENGLVTARVQRVIINGKNSCSGRVVMGSPRLCITTFTLDSGINSSNGSKKGGQDNMDRHNKNLCSTKENLH